ncbi:hypothetical protein [Burkholderia ubonensis]|uniref:hypothetical protein n=1 Tax=Burkholderia ubonensis TaxID=101571 RepID=UPI000ABB936E|nr:hypothetical protein [Burkholderia ubonensis]
MEHPGDRALVNEIARAILVDVAPNEVPVFSAVSIAYFANPKAAVKQARSKNSILGFGMDSTILLTPAVLHIVSEVCIFLAAEAAKDVLGDAIHEAVRPFFIKPAPPDPKAQSNLTKEQIGKVHEIVLLNSKKLRLPAALAHSLANAITAQLVSLKE